MLLDECRSGTTIVLTPHGRLDAHAAQAFDERLHAHCDAGELAILLDCTDLDYVSSVGLRSLLSASKRLTSRDGRLALCCTTANVREVLRISGFDTILELHPDLATALAAVG